MRRKRRQPARFLAMTRGNGKRGQKLNDKEEKLGIEQVFPNKTRELIRKSAISDVIEDKKSVVDTNIKF